MPRRVAFTENQVREAVAASRSWAEVLRSIGLRPAGGNFRTIQRYVNDVWEIDTSHFDPGAARAAFHESARPLEEVLVKGSTYKRASLKRRLFDDGLKERKCELCGQDETWRGRRMSLILDHKNGDATDNRLENLRIVCPNCNATFETHCGKNKLGRPVRQCRQCEDTFRPQTKEQVFCSRSCATAHNAPLQRTVDRPPLQDLLCMIDSEGYEAVGRRFGVSGNAIRKWVKACGVAPPPGPGRDFNPPPAPTRKLTPEQATRALLMLASGVSVYRVAKLFGMSQKCVKKLRDGETYKDIVRPGQLRAVG